MNGEPAFRKRWLVLGWLLCALNAVLMLAALREMLARPGWTGDLRMRWGEELLFWNRQNPYLAWKHGSGKTLLARNLHGEQETISLGPGGYPPWSFVTASLLVPPARFSEARLYFGLLNIAALAFCGFAISRVATANRRLRSVLVIGSLCLSSHAVTLRLGQYGILVNAALFGLLLLPDRRYQVLKGILLTIAAVKPQIGGLFFLIPLFRGEITAVAIGGGMILAESAFFCWFTQTPPTMIFGQMLAQSSEWLGEDNGVIALLIRLGVPGRAALGACLAGGLAGTAALLWKERRAAVPSLFAIAALGGRLWMYHRRYDDCMLVFLMVLVLLNLGGNATKIDVFAAGLMGLSLWLPLRDTDQSSVVIGAKILCWCLALWTTHRSATMKRGATPALTSLAA